MDIRKIKAYPVPCYPDKDAALQNPTLLLAAPERWKRNAAACAALAGTSAMLLSSCKVLSRLTGGGPAAVPVPFFEHGDGFGGFGCVSVAPPAFLTESEAYTVISEEAAKEGIEFGQGGKELENIRVPRTAMGPDEKKYVTGYKTQSLELDGYDDTKKLAFEYVSWEDVEAWCAKPTNASVTVYPFIDTAKALNKSLNSAKTGMPVAVFYDPSYRYEDTQQIIEDNQSDYEAMEEKLKEYVKEDLREQVRGFIEWLKAEGIV